MFPRFMQSSQLRGDRVCQQREAKKTIDLDRNTVKFKRIKCKLLHCIWITDFAAGNIALSTWYCISGRPSHWLIKVKITSMCNESKYDSDEVNIFS